MRYERKYRIENLDLACVRQAVFSHPSSFRKLFPDRQINNLYLDTPEMHFFGENLAGNAERRKYRIRWYGTEIGLATDPVLEVKIKDGELGEKLLKPLPTFQVTENAGLAQFIDAAIAELKVQNLPAIEKKAIPDSKYFPALNLKLNQWTEVKTKADSDHPLVHSTRIVHPEVKLRPSLLNTYQRSYLISADQRFRLTIDWDMRFYAFNAKQQRSLFPVSDAAIVVELKYAPADDQDFAITVGQGIPFRLGKNSKYVNGILLIGNV